MSKSIFALTLFIPILVGRLNGALPVEPDQPLTVHCVAAEGKPVANAEVHLFQCNKHDVNGHYIHTGPVNSDEAGRAVFSKSITWNADGNFDRWIYAKVPGKLVGVARSVQFSNGNSFNVDARVVLWPSRSVEGRVTVPDGFDPRSVTIKVITMHVVTGDNDFDFVSFSREDTFQGLNRSLRAQFETRPDAEGRFQFQDIPVRGRLYLLTYGKGLGQAQYHNRGKDRTFDEPIAMTIHRESRLSGRVIDPDGRPVVGISVRARIGSRAGASYLTTFETEMNERGEFESFGLPAMELDITARDPNNKWIMRPFSIAPINSGEHRSIELKVEPAVRVSGRVVDSKGNPIKQVSITAVAEPGQLVLASGSTDDKGMYEMRLPSGKADFYINGVPNGFKYPNPPLVDSLEIEPNQVIDDLDFELERAESEVKKDSK